MSHLAFILKFWGHICCPLSGEVAKYLLGPLALSIRNLASLITPNKPRAIIMSFLSFLSMDLPFGPLVKSRWGRNKKD